MSRCTSLVASLIYAASGGERTLHELHDETPTRRGHRPQGAQLPRIPPTVQQRMGRRAYLPQMMNKVSVACSWNCFIARDRSPEFEQLVSSIGERTRELIDDMVGAAFEEYE